MKNPTFKIAAAAMMVAGAFATQTYAAFFRRRPSRDASLRLSIDRSFPLKNPTFKIAAAAMMVAGAFATQTYAAGFQLSEQSAIQMGRAMAGAGVVGDDLSAVHYNPAGMTLLSGTRMQATGTWVAVNLDYEGDSGQSENGLVGDDLSAVHYNPAGMTLLSGTRMQATGTWVAVNLDYEGDSGQSENGRLKGQIIPAGFITHQINDSLWAGLGLTVPYGMGTEFGEGWEGRERGTESMILTFDINPNLAWKVNSLWAGLGLTVPYGMGTEFGEGWEGRERGTESMILTFDINPNLAWKVNEKLSVGGGVSLQYAKAELGSGRIVSENGHTINSNVKGDSWAWGWNVGVMFQPVETVRLGLAYRSNISHNADGHTTLNNVPVKIDNGLVLTNIRSDMEVRIKTPDTITFSATWEATDALRLSGTARWSKWSNFHSLDVQNLDLAGTQFSSTVVENNWDDTWFFSVGADYKLSENGHTINSNVKGDSWAWGWNVGVMFQPVETVRLGLAYRSNISHNADGHTTLNNVPVKIDNGLVLTNIRSDMEVRIKTPDTITFSATWEATDALRLSGTARWSKWSNFHSLDVQNLDLAGTQFSSTVVENNWDDTWFFSVGADYKLNGQWTIRGGVAYDQGPVENQYRMAVIPDTDRVWFSGGASYKYTDNLTFDFGATYIKGVGDTDLAWPSFPTPTASGSRAAPPTSTRTT